RHLVWSDSLGALAVLRGQVDSTARDTLFSVVTFTKVASGTPAKAVFDPAQHSEFPSGMKIAADRAPRLTDDLSAVFFAIRAVNPRAPTTVAANGRGNVVQAGAPGEGGTRNQPANQADELPSLVLWHNKDPRLQSQQLT